MDRICAYLQQKKAENNLSWAEIAATAKQPESTVRKIAGGQTLDPRISTFVSIVYAVGGNMQEVSELLNDVLIDLDIGASFVLKVEVKEEVKVIPPTTVNESDLLVPLDRSELRELKSAYEARIADIKEAHLRENDRAKMVHLRHLHSLRTMCWSLGIALAVVLLILLVMIILPPG